MKNKKVIYKDLGQIDYKECWDYQEHLFKQILDSKGRQQPSVPENIPAPAQYLLFCEHPHVYTLGKSGSENNLLVDFIQLQAKNAAFYHINRGGDITYHGPGQIVGYPILDLENFGLGVKSYIHFLEEAVIQTLDTYGIRAGRLDGATGVWLEAGIPGRTRKICAIGVRVSRWVSMHGFAFNVNTDLNYFGLINPCGFTDKAVTTMEKELGGRQDFEEVKARLRDRLAALAGMELQ